jgi:hypothetical protein
MIISEADDEHADNGIELVADKKDGCREDI